MKSNSIYIIIDFNAKYSFQHNTPLIWVFSKILKNNSHTLYLLLPKKCDKFSFLHTDGIKKYILTSPVFGPTFMESPLDFLFFKFTNFIFRASGKNLYLKSKFRSYLVSRPLKFIKNLRTSNTGNIYIVFPSMDPLSVELVKNLVSSGFFKNIYIIYRVVETETRGSIASTQELQTICNLSQTYPGFFRLGVETQGFENLLLNLGFKKELIFWSPWPQFDYKEIDISVSTPIRIGFLGTAKIRKGFDKLPEILRELKSLDIGLEVLIQQAVFSWPGYVDTVKNLESNYSEIIRFLPAKLSLRELQLNIQKTHLLILPYDSLSYRINASGLVYHAADYGIPVIAEKGVGFADEIIENKIGFIYENISEIPDLVSLCVNNRDRFDFELYNSKRQKANLDFLLKFD